jgi:hypothetical protein
MKLGIATVITDEGIRPDVLAKALEDGGFDSLTAEPGRSAGAWADRANMPNA